MTDQPPQADPLKTLREWGPFTAKEFYVSDCRGNARAMAGDDAAAIAYAINSALEADAKLAEKDRKIARLQGQQEDDRRQIEALRRLVSHYEDDIADQARRAAKEESRADLHADINRRVAEALGKPTGSSWHDLPECVGKLRTNLDAQIRSSESWRLDVLRQQDRVRARDGEITTLKQRIRELEAKP